MFGQILEMVNCMTQTEPALQDFHTKQPRQATAFEGCQGLVIAQHHGGDHTGGNGDQQIVAAVLDPVIAARRADRRWPRQSFTT